MENYMDDEIIYEMMRNNDIGSSSQNPEHTRQADNEANSLNSPDEVMESEDEDIDSEKEEDVIDIEARQVVGEPYVGMEFPTHEDAFEFYNSYGRFKGFGTRKYSSERSRRSGIVISRIFVCNKQGYKATNDKREEGKQVVRRRDTRCGCKAKMVIGLTGSGTWKIRVFSDDHVHPLFTTPEKVLKHRSHKKFHKTKSCRDLMESLSGRGLKPSTISKVLNELRGSLEDTVTPQECHDYLRIGRTNNIGRECASIINHFQDKRSKDPDFYFTIEVDEFRTLRSVFWADGRSRSSYLNFSDIVAFDVTYKTNKFSLPFAPFTGVNHHGQSTLLGCALLADEREDTFIWLFKQWMKCMWGKAPNAIITDMDKAICNAIKEVFPHTHHRYCSWHLGKHVVEQLQPLRIIHGEQFEKDYQEWFYSKTILDSEQRWEYLKNKYKLALNTWLPNMYDRRIHWVPVYLKETFFAGMTSSQRSESINSFFDGYVHALTPLDEFVKQYENAVRDRRSSESDEDFRTMNSEPTLTSKFPIEAQAGKSYTRKLFGIFQHEFTASLMCWNKKVSKEVPKERASIMEYIVGLPSDNENIWQHVTIDMSDISKAKCSCAMFETQGILCKHVLNILNKKRFNVLPEYFILKRWTIGVRHHVSSINSNGLLKQRLVNETVITPLMRWSIRSKCNRLLHEADNSINLHKEIDAFLTKKLRELEPHLTYNKVTAIESST